MDADADRFRGFLIDGVADLLSVIDQFAGGPLDKDWPPAEMKLVEDPDSARWPLGDFTTLYGIVPVFRAAAVASLGPLLTSCGELFPLGADKADFAFNITRIVDGLDEAASVVVRSPNDANRILMISRYAFLPDIEARLDGAGIFKLSQGPRAMSYATERFVSAVNGLGLKGFLFRLLN